MSRRWVLLLLILVLIIALPYAVLSLGMGLRAFQVPSGSMADTFLPGDFVLAAMKAYPGDGPGPRPGELIVFFHEDSGVFYEKRCVAVEGDLVEVRDGVLHRNGEAVDERYVKFLYAGAVPHFAAPRDWGPFTVPEGEIFLLGDNRDNSRDGRQMGFHAWRETPRGKVKRIYWSWDAEAGRPRWRRLGSVPR